MDEALCQDCWTIPKQNQESWKKFKNYINIRKVWYHLEKCLHIVGHIVREPKNKMSKYQHFQEYYFGLSWSSEIVGKYEDTTMFVYIKK